MCRLTLAVLGTEKLFSVCRRRLFTNTLAIDRADMKLNRHICKHKFFKLFVKSYKNTNYKVEISLQLVDQDEWFLK